MRPNAWRARSPGRGRHSFKTNEAAHVVDEVRHSDFAPRADDADGAHELGSHAVLLITKYMLDAGAHLERAVLATFCASLGLRLISVFPLPKVE